LTTGRQIWAMTSHDGLIGQPPNDALSVLGSSRVTPHAVEVLYQHQQQELETRRQSVDLMNRDVSSLQSRLSALQNENDELKQTLCVST